MRGNHCRLLQIGGMSRIRGLREWAGEQDATQKKEKNTFEINYIVVAKGAIVYNYISCCGDHTRSRDDTHC